MLFHLQGIIPMAPKECWTEMVTNLNESPRWNPTVIESRVSMLCVRDRVWFSGLYGEKIPEL